MLTLNNETLWNIPKKVFSSSISYFNIKKKMPPFKLLFNYQIHRQLFKTKTNRTRKIKYRYQLKEFI